MLPKIFYGYFEVNASVHSYATLSAEKLHVYSVSSSSRAKCVFNFKGEISIGRKLSVDTHGFAESHVRRQRFLRWRREM